MASSQSPGTALRVLSLGMSRTGTSSMKAALQILGYSNVHHAYELYSHPEQARLWLDAWKAKRQYGAQATIDWEGILAPYSAVTDMPAVCFAPELLSFYPQAKVVLVQREASSWYESFNKGVIETFWDNRNVTGILSLLDPELIKPVHQLWDALFARKDGYFHAQTREEMQANAKLVYEEHYDLIRKSCSEERLLEYDLKDGWAPLCKFLECEVPDVPFPRLNEGDEIKAIVGHFVGRSMKRVVRNLALGVLVVALSVESFRRVYFK